MIEKWMWNLDKGSSCDAQWTGLSKAFDCILHDFLTAKLEASSFTYEALNFIKNRLSDRTDRTKNEWFLQLIFRFTNKSPSRRLLLVNLIPFI